MSSLAQLLLFFVLIVGGGLYTQKKQPKLFNQWLKIFGYLVVAANFAVVFMIMRATELAFADRLATAFLNAVVAIVIMTLVQKKTKYDERE